MDMTSHAEIERKYDVDEHTVLPRFDALGSVGIAGAAEPSGVKLSAQYFDTADGALADRRITLRRRSGGADAGWHLKLPAAEGRSELGWPLTDDDSVPPAVLDPVRGIVRDHPLSVIARITTQRTIVRLVGDDGRELVEMADDRVSASDVASGILRTWREWEAELLDGAPDTAGERARMLDAVEQTLLRAGAVPAKSASKLASALGRTGLGASPQPVESTGDSPASAVLVAALRPLVRQLVDLDTAVRAGAPDSVHQLRTRIRRVRSLLVGYRAVFDPATADDLDARLRDVGAVLGDARDAEVMRQRAAALVDDHPEVPRSLRDALLADFDGGSAGARVLAELSGERYFRLLDALDEVVARPALAPEAHRRASHVIPRALRTQRKKVLARWKRADAATSASERTALLHSTRKAAKRLRYMAEAVGGIAGTHVGALADAAKSVHDLLGEHRDSELMQHHLRRSASSSGHAFEYGVLHEIERASAANSLAAARTSMRKLRRARVF